MYFFNGKINAFVDFAAKYSNNLWFSKMRAHTTNIKNDALFNGALSSQGRIQGGASGHLHPWPFQGVLVHPLETWDKI